MRKTQVDRRVAVLLGMKQREVSLITEAFLKEMMKGLVQDGLLILESFGKFKLYSTSGVRQEIRKLTSVHGRGLLVRVPKQFKVSFSKAEALRKFINEAHGLEEVTMEKYAVDEEVDQEDLEKKAAAGCPNCGSKPTKHGKVLVCPKCGTEGFEKVND